MLLVVSGAAVQSPPSYRHSAELHLQPPSLRFSRVSPTVQYTFHYVRLDVRQHGLVSMCCQLHTAFPGTTVGSPINHW